MPQNNKLNDLKDSFAEAYFFAIAAAAGISLERPTRKTDNKGIDLTAFKGGGKILGSSINIQLKGVSENSTTMLIQEEGCIKYNYINPCQPTFIHYLVVVKLPDDTDVKSWLELTEEELILKKCAYFWRIVPGIKSGFIKIPRTQLLTHSNLHNLFPDPSQIASLL